jgi:NAD(P)H-hydrate epimerase
MPDTSPPQSLVLTRAQVREIDRRAIEDYGVPGIVLMENAGRNAAGVALEVLASIEQRDGFKAQRPLAAIVCGGGSNGGDGYVVARHLANAGVEVQIISIKPPIELDGDAAAQWHIVDRMGLSLVVAEGAEGMGEAAAILDAADLIVDAILGTGFSGDRVRDPADAVITLINQAADDGTAVLAVDVPSGLDCDSGKPADPTVRADATVTFIALKPALADPNLEPWCGQVLVADIGVPVNLITAASGAAGQQPPPSA